jgi:hypothetical protein
LVAESEALPVEARTRPDDYDYSWRVPLDEDSWVDEHGVSWSEPKRASLSTLTDLMARPEIRVLHASPSDQINDVNPQNRDALLRAVEDNWKGREEYLNGYQNYSARVFKDHIGRSLVVVQQWCSP